MEVQQKRISATGIRFSLVDAGRQEVARAYLYILSNDLHKQPFGLLEDVFVEEEVRQQGLAAQILQAVVETAREQGCYKLVGTSRESRPNVHRLYLRHGFKEWGKEFRMDFENPQEG